MKENVPPLTLVRPPPPQREASTSPPREVSFDVVTAGKRGDQAACRAIVECYQARVFAVVGRTLGARGVPGERGAGRAARVEDVCQECFLRVWRAVFRYSGIQVFRCSGPTRTGSPLSLPVLNT